LIAPQGVFAIVTRYQDGRFTVQGDRWTRHQSTGGRILGAFRFDNVGNPTVDALRAAAHVQKQIDAIAADVTVQPLIVFVDPRAEVEVIDPVVPVAFPDMSKKKPSIKDHLWSVGRGQFQTLTPEQIEAFEAATLPHR
jgi:hypothetical protein